MTLVRPFLATLHSLASLAVAGVALAACNSTALRVGGAPEASVKNCVAAVARDLKVPPSAVGVASTSTPRDGIYDIVLRVGERQRSAVCRADDNGAVLGTDYKRAD